MFKLINLLKISAILLALQIHPQSYAEQLQFLTENNPPFQIYEPEKPTTGFAIELLKIVIEKAKIDANITVLPWARAYSTALSKPNTFIFSIGRTQEREKLFKWVGDYYDVINGMYALRKSKLEFSSINDAKQFLTCVPRGDYSENRLKEYGFTTSMIYPVIRQEQCIRMLVKGRVDLNMNNELGFYGNVSKLNKNPALFTRVFVESKVPLGLAANKDTSDDLVELIATTLKKLKQDGTHKRLKDTWFTVLP